MNNKLINNKTNHFGEIFFWKKKSRYFLGSGFVIDSNAGSGSVLKLNRSATLIICFEGPEQSKVVGFCAALTACCLSGFAGVYFEKILKGIPYITLSRILENNCTKHHNTCSENRHPIGVL